MIATDTSGALPHDRQTKPHHQSEPDKGEDNGYLQTMYILVSRGFPRDSESARTIDICIVANDDSHKDTTYRLEGSHGAYVLKVLSDVGPFHSRPHFVRQFHVASVPAASTGKAKLHELVVDTPISNDNPEWTRWTWIDNVLGALTAAGMITSDEATEVLDATIDCVSSAPYPE